MRTDLRVAVVGAGPAGLYVADALTFQEQIPVKVDIYDRLPTPFGLLRYGVAPDHLKMKSLVHTLQRTLDDERVRFLGNVNVGSDITVDELRQAYDAVVYTYGASTDRRLGIDGEALPGSRSATDFVTWYSGHPDTPADRFELSTVRTVVVVGMGNVAIDVARVLSKSVHALQSTDIPEPVLDLLSSSAVADVYLLGRRGPVHAKFTSKELKELGELDGVDVVVDPDQLVLGAQEQAELAAEPARARNLEILTEWSGRPLSGAPRRLHLRFWSRPVALSGMTHLEAVRIEPTTLEQGRVVAAGPAYELGAQLLLRSVGYRGVAIPGVPIDHERCVVPNADGRVLRAGAVSPGEYVAGWIGRGPVGVLGTNRADATKVVGKLLEDGPDLLAAPGPSRVVDELLGQRDIRAVGAAGWATIDRAERELGASRGRPRTKLDSWDALLKAAAAGASAPVLR